MTETDTIVRPSSVPAVIAIFLAALGAITMVWSFVAGINAALDGDGTIARALTIAFLVGAAGVVAALVLGIIGLVRRRAPGLSVVAIVIALLPVVGVIAVRIAAIS